LFGEAAIDTVLRFNGCITVGERLEADDAKRFDGWNVGIFDWGNEEGKRSVFGKRTTESAEDEVDVVRLKTSWHEGAKPESCSGLTKSG
jgi:hypothetical protein